MLAVLLWTLTMVASLVLTYGHLYQNHWKPVYMKEISISGMIVGWLLQALFAWWIIASVGWVGATMWLVGYYLAAFVLNLVDYARFEMPRTTLFEALLFLPVQIGLIIALWVAAAS